MYVNLSIYSNRTVTLPNSEINKSQFNLKSSIYSNKIVILWYIPKIREHNIEHIRLFLCTTQKHNK